MEHSSPVGDTRPFGIEVDAAQPPHEPVVDSTSVTPARPVRSFVLEEIVDPWQPVRPVARSAEIVDPWREPQPLDTDPELIDPWRSERSLASVSASSAAFDWDTSLPELLNPWPATVAPLAYELNELVDPWSKL
jgi:hypothetical protein